MSKVAIGEFAGHCMNIVLIYARLIDSSISTPMSRWEEYRASRTTWGINVLGSFCVEIEATDGTTGFATGFGGEDVCH